MIFDLWKKNSIPASNLKNIEDESNIRLNKEDEPYDRRKKKNPIEDWPDKKSETNLIKDRIKKTYTNRS